MKSLLSLVMLLSSFGTFAQMNKASDDLFQIASRENSGKSPRQIETANLENYDRFVLLDTNSYVYNPHASRDAGKKTTITKTQAQLLIDEAEKNPVVALHQYDKYDPQDKGIGFCFGRAMFTHIYLATAGLNRGNVKKAWLIGPMSSGSWAWHVTTIAQSKVGHKEVWYALDPVVGYPLEVKAWYGHWLKSSDDKKLRLYISEAGKMFPSPSTYDEKTKRNAYYNSYFQDMHDWFERNNVKDLLK